MPEIKVAILGYGGIARAHHSGYRILAAEGYPVRLVALVETLKASADARGKELPFVPKA